MELPDRHYPTNATLGYQNDWTVSQKAPKAAPLFRATPREREAALAALGTRQAIKQARKDKHLLFEAILQVRGAKKCKSAFLVKSTLIEGRFRNALACKGNCTFNQ